MKIYLDNCVLQRPLDDKSQIRIRLEAEAVLSLIEMLQMADLELISSEVLEFEIEKTPSSVRRNYANLVLGNAGTRVEINEDLEKRAQDFIKSGVKPLDALHLASGEAANVDYFCTCDNRFLRRAQNLSNLRVKVVTPLELIERLSR
ncbi:MAG: PIN domain-containing protein [Chloroflexota bacterium]